MASVPVPALRVLALIYLHDGLSFGHVSKKKKNSK